MQIKRDGEKREFCGRPSCQEMVVRVLLFTLVALPWIRGEFVSDELSAVFIYRLDVTDQVAFSVRSDSGHLYFWRNRRYSSAYQSGARPRMVKYTFSSNNGFRTRMEWPTPDDVERDTFDFLGLGYSFIKRDYGAPNRYALDNRYLEDDYVYVPYWLLTLLTAWPAARSSARFVTARRTAYRHELGLCHACGYDMRASPDRCPECGFVYMKTVSS